MADWKTDLRTLADKLRLEQKNKKGVESKFDKVVGYKNKKGFNDTGIPLTAKQPRVYAGIKPLIEADILARHCSKLTKRGQLKVRKDGSIYDRVLDTVQIQIELKIFLFPR